MILVWRNREVLLGLLSPERREPHFLHSSSGTCGQSPFGDLSFYCILCIFTCASLKDALSHRPGAVLTYSPRITHFVFSTFHLQWPITRSPPGQLSVRSSLTLSLGYYSASSARDAIPSFYPNSLLPLSLFSYVSCCTGLTHSAMMNSSFAIDN